jgi:hypothetical protein
MKTTLNVHRDILKMITRIAVKQGVSRTDIIIKLLKSVMNDISGPCDFGCLVRYQKQGNPEDWHRFHIKLRIDEYEYFLDLRRLLKMSVSRILATAVKRYLGNDNKKYVCDNNQFKNYVIIKELFDNSICWKLVWGYPYNIEKLL